MNSVNENVCLMQCENGSINEENAFRSQGHATSQDGILCECTNRVHRICMDQWIAFQLSNFNRNTCIFGKGIIDLTPAETSRMRSMLVKAAALLALKTFAKETLKTGAVAYSMYAVYKALEMAKSKGGRVQDIFATKEHLIAIVYAVYQALHSIVPLSLTQVSKPFLKSKIELLTLFALSSLAMGSLLYSFKSKTADFLKISNTADFSAGLAYGFLLISQYNVYKKILNS